ncbi:MAG: hypothetical protein HDT44_00245 [Ruminococcaceae bacterium]|nr:hypothetical protein [Oscillospiraceae bacterium]
MKKNTKKIKPYQILMIALFALFLAAMPILTLIYNPSEPKPFSENENRYLAEFPKFSFETYKNEKFMTGFDDWLSDRFYGREEWISLKNSADKLLGKTENNGVFTENDMMMQIWNGYNEEIYNKNLKAINNFVENNSQLPCYFMLVPNAQEIYSENVPAYAEVGSIKEFIDKFYSDLDTSIKTIDAYTALNENKDSYIYYRTDHHWTSLGAFLAYTAAADTLGYSAAAYDDFDIEHASDSFRGTLFSKTLDKGVTADVMDYYTLKENEPQVKVSVFKEFDMTTGQITYDEYDSLYFREYLDVKDKYSSFLGQNSPLVTVENPDAKTDKSLLVIKDSYAHCLVPFLSKEYKKVSMIDLRYINMDFRVMAPLKEYDQMMFVYNVITFSEDESNLLKLNMCK